MAVAKVTINGTTILDLTDATASNGKVLTGYSAYGADGSKMAGTAIECPDIPTFTSDEQATTISCDKTYAECYALASTNDLRAFLEIEGFGSAVLAAALIDHQGDPIKYYFMANGEPVLQVTYESDGTITISEPDTVTALTVTENGHYGGALYGSVDVNVPSPPLQSKTAFVTAYEETSRNTVTPDEGYVGMSTVEVYVNPIPSNYVGSAIDRRSSTDLTASGATVTVPSGYYSSQASKAVASGTAGTPTATKGTVANHAVSITPSVTNTTGYITGGTKTGEAVSVSASELVSGTKLISTPGTTDVTNYASVDVPTGTISPEAVKGVVSGNSVNVRARANVTYGWVASESTPGTTVTVSASELVSGTKSITENGTGIDVTNYAAVDVAVPAPTPNLQSKTATPTESVQTITADTGYDGLDEVEVEAISSTYVGSEIARRSSTDLTTSGSTVTAPAGYYETSASKSIASGSATTPATTITANPSISINTTTGLITATASGSKSVTPTVSAGYVSSGTAGTVSVSGSNTEQLSVQAGKTVTPTETEQTAVAAGKYTTGAVKVGAISSTYVGSGIDQRDETDLTASGATVTVPAGYYAEQETKSVASGTAGTPTATKGTVTNHAVSVTPSVTNTTGYITGGTKTGTAVSVSASELVSGTKSISANGTGIDVTNYASVDVAVPAPTPNLQSKTATPTESVQTITADTGYDGLDEVEVEAISSTYVGSDITRRSSSDLTASGATVTVPSGYYSSQASKAVASGTAGTPTASKGTVSNNSISVTPSVTNTTGYITGGTKTGTAVTVSASELVSGTYSVTSSGTKDVTNYASASVPSGTAGTPTASKGTVSNHAISVTPSVTNTTGFITGSTKTGTAVTVSASELVSGTLSVTSNGTKDVTNYASVSVAIPIVTYYTGTSTPSSSLGSNNDIYLKTVS